MLPKRVIPCLDVMDGRVVKGTEFVDIKDAGDPAMLAKRYEAQGADELVFLDISATSDGRSTMVDIARQTASGVFIPFTAGGGVRSANDVQDLLDAGADKVAINSAALAEPAVIGRLATRFGSQCIVLAVDAKKNDRGGWEAYAAGGRESTGRDVIDWARQAVTLGAGEILLTSIDRDGTKSGYDIGLLKAVTDVVNVPVIASGGAGQLEHYSQAIYEGGAEAVLAASEFHSGRQTVSQVKAALRDDGIPVRAAELAVECRRLCKDENPAIAIVDYGVGNHYSLQQALREVGASATVTADPKELEYANGLVLPGVGAYGMAMERLRSTGLDAVVRQQARADKPILGICLGEQLLFESSEESRCEGLGILSGNVVKIKTPYKPNMGWRELHLEMFDNLFLYQGQGSQFYHAHEYAALPNDPVWTLAQTALSYDENPYYKVVSAIRQGNIYGVQFHPEKSSWCGLQLLRNFVDISALAVTRL